MPPHVVGAEVIELPIPSYGVKSCLGADDGSVLGSVPDLEHALTGIAENRFCYSMALVQLSLNVFEQRLEQVVYHFPVPRLALIRSFVKIDLKYPL